MLSPFAGSIILLGVCLHPHACEVLKQPLQFAIHDLGRIVTLRDVIREGDR